MSTAKKFELAPDEVYIQEALKKARAAVMEVSMKALGIPDVAFQARVKHLDMDHVYRLRMIFDQEGRLSPVVIFRTDDPKDTRMILADGFHRHEVYRRAGATAIRAYVITVPADHLEHEARLFAAMCNQELSLGRTPQDVRKAVEMLFADPECWEWANTRIGEHCGISSSTVEKYRTQFARSNQVNTPEFVYSKDGCRRPYRTGRTDPQKKKLYETTVGKKTHFRFIDKGKMVNLGTDKGEAEAKFASFKENKERLVKISPSQLIKWFSHCDLAFHSVTSHCNFSHPGLRGIMGHGCLVTTFPERDPLNIPWAVGCLYMLRKLIEEPVSRIVVLCYHEDLPTANIDLARKLGIEFLTPDELVASLKNEAE